MQLAHAARVSAEPEALRARLRDVAGWATWLPGVQGLVLSEEGREVELVLGGARPLRVRLRLDETPAGVRFQLVEGELPGAEGELEVHAEEQGARVVARMRLDFPVVLPGPLVRELEREVLPRWVAAWVSSAR